MTNFMKALEAYGKRINSEKGVPDKHDSRKATRHPVETRKNKLKSYGIVDAMTQSLRNKSK